MKQPLKGVAYRNEFYKDFNEYLKCAEMVEFMPEHFMRNNRIEIDDELIMNETTIKSFHTVLFSLSSEDSVDTKLIETMNGAIDKYKIKYISDHLAATKINSNLQDVFYPQILDGSEYELVEKINTINSILNIPLDIENPATTFFIGGNFEAEIKLLDMICSQTESKMLLDLSNLYINARNFGFSPLEYIDSIDCDAVRGVHLAGHECQGGWYIDTHMTNICDEVWSLFRYSLERFNIEYTIIERDQNSSTLANNLKEMKKLESFLASP